MVSHCAGGETEARACCQGATLQVGTVGSWCHSWSAHRPPAARGGRGAVMGGQQSRRLSGGKGCGKESAMGMAGPQTPGDLAPCPRSVAMVGGALGCPWGGCVCDAAPTKGWCGRPLGPLYPPPARGAAGGAEGLRPSGSPHGGAGTRLGGAAGAVLSRCHRAICRQRHSPPWPPAASQSSQSSQSAAAPGASSRRGAGWDAAETTLLRPRTD